MNRAETESRLTEALAELDAIYTRSTIWPRC